MIRRTHRWLRSDSVSVLCRIRRRVDPFSEMSENATIEERRLGLRVVGHCQPLDSSSRSTKKAGARWYDRKCRRPARSSSFADSIQSTGSGSFSGIGASAAGWTDDVAASPDAPAARGLTVAVRCLCAPREQQDQQQHPYVAPHGPTDISDWILSRNPVASPHKLARGSSAKPRD